jgi:hypothetical protein
MQTAPSLPNGTTWTATDAQGSTIPGPGQHLPKDFLPPGMVTETSWWKGPYTSSNDTQQTRWGGTQVMAAGRLCKGGGGAACRAPRTADGGSPAGRPPG